MFSDAARAGQIRAGIDGLGYHGRHISKLQVRLMVELRYQCLSRFFDLWRRVQPGRPAGAGRMAGSTDFHTGQIVIRGLRARRGGSVTKDTGQLLLKMKPMGKLGATCKGGEEQAGNPACPETYFL
jgi:hypothetical protein